MNFNFFEWLRDGVRRSVLLGVSDAVETMGVPDTEKDPHPAIAGLFGEEAKSLAAPKSPRKRTTKTSQRRLGKSLKEIAPTK